MKKLSNDSIKKGDFESYKTVIMHEWLTTLALLVTVLVPFFFALDIFMMPSALLPKFAVYRALSAFTAFIQLLIVRRSKPGKWSYIHAYFLSFQVGGMISLMTNDLGGFNSSYYAGLNLIMIAANLLMPWQAYHTMVNAIITLSMYVGINLFAGKPFEPSIMINNLFFLGSTAIIVASINYVRFLLIKSEFNLLVELDRSGQALSAEKELVEDRNKAIKSLLDVSGQGFLSFGSDFLINSEYSRECENIFGRPISRLRIDKILFADAQTGGNFKKGLDLYFDGKVKPEVVFDLLDHNLSIGSLSVKAEYKAVDQGRIMIALTDITEELRVQEQFRKENEFKAMLLKVIANRQLFTSFNKESKRLFQDLKTRKDGYEIMARSVHTFKANAGFLGFKKTNIAAHTLEDYLNDHIVMGQPLNSEESISLLEAAYEEEYTDIVQALGKDWQTDTEVIELPRSTYMNMEEFIKVNCTDQTLIHQLEGFRKKEFAVLFDRFPQLVSDLSMRLGKRVAPIKINGGEIRVFPEEYESLIDSFGHLIRNMMDHGIEQPANRESKGKPAEGKVSIEIQEGANEIFFVFSDDGQGLQLKDIAKKAKEQGLIEDINAASPAELVNLIFHDNFSTAKNVTDLSGRGVGLSAVMQEVKQRAGHIKVNTEKNKGTVFTISIPRTQSTRKEVTQ